MLLGEWWAANPTDAAEAYKPPDPADRVPGTLREAGNGEFALETIGFLGDRPSMAGGPPTASDRSRPEIWGTDRDSTCYSLFDNLRSNTTCATLSGMVADTVRPGSTVFTDGDRGYDPLKAMGFLHAKVLHSVGEYVRGPVSTNGIENYWSHLKRTYIGTYHYMSPEHLHRYATEHSFRYNRRKCHVIDRMADAAAAMSGRRLPWKELVAHGPHAGGGSLQPEPW
jgi:transposase-like protein